MYASLLVAVVGRWNISEEQFLSGSGLCAEELGQPFWALDYEVFRYLLRRALTLTAEPGLGFHLAKEMTVASHGLVGMAILVAKDLREAIAVIQQFIQLQSTELRIRMEVEGDSASVCFEQSWPDSDVGQVAMIFVMLGFALMSRTCTGHDMSGVSMDFPFPRPAYFERFEHMLLGPVRFDQPEGRNVFPASYLDMPMIMANTVAARLTQEQCQLEVDALASSSGIADLVRGLIYDEVVGFCTQEQVAEKLHMTARTLQRHLDQAGKGFRVIAEELRHAKALALLKRQDLSLVFIAERLGYKDVTNFARAFKRWTGMTPGKCREGSRHK